MSKTKEKSSSSLDRFLGAYARAYQGLSAQSWRLTLAVFIQRAGTMVLPFLTIYLAKEAQLSEAKVASVILFHGLGAVAGSLLATQSLARFSTRANMLGSLLATAAAIMALYAAQNYLWICICAALFMLCEAPFRPAVMTELSRHEAPENQSQAIALLRVGINAGMMLGPAVGGILAMQDYAYLFYVDAATCLLAALWLVFQVSPPQPLETKQEAKSNSKTRSEVLKDPVFWLLWLAQFFQFLVIFQLVGALPLFLSQARGFNEAQVGHYFLINGLMILAIEMWLVRWVRNLRPPLVFGVGACVMALGIAAVELVHAPWLIYLSVVIWTAGEMVSMPILHGIVVTRAKENTAAYLSWFSTATNVALVVAGPSGLWIAHQYGYPSLWASVCVLGFCCLGLGFAIQHKINAKPA